MTRQDAAMLSGLVRAGQRKEADGDGWGCGLDELAAVPPASRVGRKQRELGVGPVGLQVSVGVQVTWQVSLAAHPTFREGAWLQLRLSSGFADRELRTRRRGGQSARAWWTDTPGSGFPEQLGLERR